MSADRFLLVTGTAQTTRDTDWIGVICRKGATLTDVTADYAVIAVMGPRARDLLARLTTAPLSHTAFPFGAIRETTSPARRCGLRAALTSASLAGSFTSASGRRARSTTR